MKQLNFGGAAAGAADDVEPTPKAAAKGKQTAAKGKQAAEKEGKKANGQGRKDAQEGTQKSNDKKQGKNAAKGKGISEGGKDVNGNRKSSATQSESAPGQVRQKGGELDWKTQRDQRAATQKVAKPEPTASRKVTGANGAALGEKDSLSAALKPTGKAIGRLVSVTVLLPVRWLSFELIRLFHLRV